MRVKFISLYLFIYLCIYISRDHICSLRGGRDGSVVVGGGGGRGSGCGGPTDITHTSTASAQVSLYERIFLFSYIHK